MNKERFKVPEGRLTWAEFTKTMCRFNEETNEEETLTGTVVFADLGALAGEPMLRRSYRINNHNKAWISGMGGYSIYGSSLDGSDPCCRLDYLMREECGKVFTVSYCYFEV